jgi:hypothetical protein
LRNGKEEWFDQRDGFAAAMVTCDCGRLVDVEMVRLLQTC